MTRMYLCRLGFRLRNERFMHLTFRSYWHYTVLRGLGYMRDRPEICDLRLEDPLKALTSRSNSRGRWIVEKRITGTIHFDMEKIGGESRWNTLRALRVLQATERGR